MPCCSAPPPDPLPEPSTLGFDEALRQYYNRKLLPVEKLHVYDQFYAPHMHEAEFGAKPAVLLIGQYSVGKTSMIEYLLNKPFPSARIGPEPTTDVFTVVCHGQHERTIQGSTLVNDQTFPYQSLAQFGSEFLNRGLKGSMTDAPLLKDLTFIDTPGILTGEKQRINRGYDFEQVVRFLADKVDYILLMFDGSKLDISDEFKIIIQCLKGNEEKVKIVLNKADSVPSNELFRVRGALMWNLGKVMQTPEVPKVYIGSFWNKPLKNKNLKQAFQEDYQSLMTELRQLPKTVKVRKLNDVSKRAKLLLSHVYLMEELMKSMTFGISLNAIKTATNPNNMSKMYEKIRRAQRIEEVDMPNKEKFRESALKSDPRKWHRINKRLLAGLEEFIRVDITKLLRTLPPDEQVQMANIEVLKKAITDFDDHGKSEKLQEGGADENVEKSASQSPSDKAKPKKTKKTTKKGRKSKGDSATPPSAPDQPDKGGSGSISFGNTPRPLSHIGGGSGGGPGVEVPLVSDKPPQAEPQQPQHNAVPPPAGQAPPPLLYEDVTNDWK